MLKRNAPPLSNTTAVRRAYGRRRWRGSIRANHPATCRRGVGCVSLMTAAVSSTTDGPNARQLSAGGRSICSAAIVRDRSLASITPGTALVAQRRHHRSNCTAIARSLKRQAARVKHTDVGPSKSAASCSRGKLHHEIENFRQASPKPLLHDPCRACSKCHAHKHAKSFVAEANKHCSGIMAVREQYVIRTDAASRSRNIQRRCTMKIT